MSVNTRTIAVSQQVSHNEDWQQARARDLGLAAGASMRLGTGQQVRELDLGLAAGASIRIGTGSRCEYQTWDWQQVRA